MGLKFCNNCKKWFLEPNEDIAIEMHMEVDTLIEEKKTRYICPWCDSTNWSDSDRCCICKKPTVPGTKICSDCELVIDLTAVELMGKHDCEMDDVLDGLVEYIELKERKMK